MSTGKYIAFVDSDDIVHSRYFEILLNCIKRNNADMVVCDYEKIVEYTQEKNIADISYSNSIKISDILSNAHYKSHIWGRIYKRELLDGIFFREGVEIGEDTVFNLQVVLNKEDTVINEVKQKLYYYLSRNDSAVKTVGHEKIVAIKDEYLKLTDQTDSDKAKKIYLNEALKNCLAHRYLTMFSINRDDKADRQNMRDCLNKLREIKHLFGFKEKAYFNALAKFPILYRAYRIYTDRSMIDWERRQRKELKRIKRGQQNG